MRSTDQKSIADGSYFWGVTEKGGGICEANDGEVNNVSDGHILLTRGTRHFFLLVQKEVAKEKAHKRGTPHCVPLLNPPAWR